MIEFSLDTSIEAESGWLTIRLFEHEFSGSRLALAFYRNFPDETFFGIGLLGFRNKHLLYIGKDGSRMRTDFLFMRLTR